MYIYIYGAPILYVYRSHTTTRQSVGLLWTSDQLVAETSTWRHTTLTRQISMPPVAFEPTISAGQRPAAARLLRSWVRIPPTAWIFVCCECRVLSGRGLCDELITRPEESYRLARHCVWSRNIKNRCSMYVCVCVCVCIYIYIYMTLVALGLIKFILCFFKNL